MLDLSNFLVSIHPFLLVPVLQQKLAHLQFVNMPVLLFPRLYREETSKAWVWSVCQAWAVFHGLSTRVSELQGPSLTSHRLSILLSSRIYFYQLYPRLVTRKSPQASPANLSPPFTANKTEEAMPTHRRNGVFMAEQAANREACSRFDLGNC